MKHTGPQPGPVAIWRKRDHDGMQLENSIAKRIGRDLLVAKLVEISGDAFARYAIGQGLRQILAGVRQEGQPTTVAAPVLVTSGRLPAGRRAALVRQRIVGR